MNTKNFFGYVKDKETNKSTIIRGTYRTKKEFICDLHANGYAVKYVCLDNEDTIEKASQKYHERLELNRNIQRAKREQEEQAREQNTVENLDNEALFYHVVSIISKLNYQLVKYIYRNKKSIVLSDNDIINYDMFTTEYINRNGIYELFSILNNFCSESVKAEYDSLNDILSIVKNNTFESTHIAYRATLKQVLLLDLIYLALYELQTIDIARKWVGTNEFDLFDKDVEKHDFTCVWFNFWLRCFIKDFLNVCKIQIGLLNRKLNKEIKQNECVTSYAEYLFYLKNKVKQDYYRLKEA